MSSTNKTEKLGLNSWIESDTPKRADFNYDNEVIDRAVSEHTENTEIHITQDERECWNNNMHIGMYYGNGATSRVINTECPFDISFGIIFANNRPVAVTKFTDARDYNYLGFISEFCNSLGIALKENKRSFSVTQSSTPAVSGEHTYFNESGLAYAYVLFR